jgi:hypothetical protein
MNNFPKPNVVVSKCLGFAKCRYDGDIVLDVIVDRLKPYVNYTTVCPEVEIGLGIPRNPIRVISDKGKLYLYQTFYLCSIPINEEKHESRSCTQGRDERISQISYS